MFSNKTGGFNTAIGNNAYSTGTYTNSTAIGYNAQITGSNQVQLGDTNINLVNTSGKLKTSKGVVLPKMAPSAITSMSTSLLENGLMVYGTDNNLYIYNDGVWRRTTLTTF